MSIAELISKTFRIKGERKWDTIYVLVDLHGTLIHSDHDKSIFYPYAVEVMKWFNSRGDIKTILWTSTHGTEMVRFLEQCKEVGIHFDYVNENPNELSSDRADFTQKLYFNILLDDKAGFDPDVDWLMIQNVLVLEGEWTKKVEPPNPKLCFKGGEHEWVRDHYDVTFFCKKCNRRCPYTELELLEGKNKT